MILSKMYCFLIVVLAYKTKHIFGGRLTKANRVCSGIIHMLNAIKDHFLVEAEHQNTKLYCIHALYNFRLSDTPENSTFKDHNGKHNIHAEEYYKWLLNYINIGPSMKTPEKYCKSLARKSLRMTNPEIKSKSIGKNRAASTRLACIEELSTIFDDLNQSKKELFQWMYNNLTLDEIQSSEFLQGYMKHVVYHFNIDDKKHRPAKFCKDYYNKEKQSLIVLTM